MPANIVKTPVQEAAWDRAKKKVSEEYPDIASTSDRYYRLVMHIYQNIAGIDKATAEVPNDVQDAVCAYVHRHGLGKSLPEQRELALRCLRAYWQAKQRTPRLVVGRWHR